jgi:Flp pilus assembly protein protease CpaA
MTGSFGLQSIQAIFVVFLCFRAAISDINTGKVPNKLLLMALAILSGTALVWGLVFNDWPWGKEKIFMFLVNISFAIASSIGMYIADIWAPGDAKLFIAIVLIYPPLLWAGSDGAIFPALRIIVWMFSLGFIYLIVSDAFSGKKNSVTFENTLIKKDGFSFSAFSQTFLRIATAYSVSLLTNALLGAVIPEFYTDNLTLCVLIIILGCIFIGKLPWWGELTIMILAAVSIYFYKPAWLQIRTFSAQSISSIIIALLIGAITQMARRNNYRRISPGDLKPGMILSVYSLCRTPQKEGFPLGITETRRSRLTAEQADMIREWAVQKHEELIIVKMVPFAPFIAVGTILEMAIGIYNLCR